jgi:hypothetical protein
MNADWTTRPYEMEDNLHLAIHLIWSNPALTGTLYLDYSCAPLIHGSMPMDIEGLWLPNNTITLDGTDNQLMILDANLAITSFRLRFVHTSGTATLESYVNRKSKGQYHANN